MIKVEAWGSQFSVLLDDIFRPVSITIKRTNEITGHKTIDFIVAANRIVVEDSIKESRHLWLIFLVRKSRQIAYENLS